MMSILVCFLCRWVGGWVGVCVSVLFSNAFENVSPHEDAGTLRSGWILSCCIFTEWDDVHFRRLTFPRLAYTSQLDQRRQFTLLQFFIFYFFKGPIWSLVSPRMSCCLANRREMFQTSYWISLSLFFLHLLVSPTYTHTHTIQRIFI